MDGKIEQHETLEMLCEASREHSLNRAVVFE
jgi:hypothetical protein